MHDTLDYMAHEPVHRAWHHDRITFGLLYAHAENFVLPLSHDEVVHGKRSILGRMPGDDWQRFANLRAYYGLMWGYPGKKLLFMGQEFGQEREWDFAGELDWHLLEHGAAPRRAARWSATSTGCTGDLPGAARARLRAGGVPLAGGGRCRAIGVRLAAAGAGRDAGGVHRQLHPGAARELPHRPAACRPLGGSAEHRRRASMAGRAWAMRARSRPRRWASHGQPASADFLLPPLRVLAGADRR